VHLRDLLTAEEKKQVVSWTDELQSWPETKGAIHIALWFCRGAHSHYVREMDAVF
jgi:hypothetical protein